MSQLDIQGSQWEGRGRDQSQIVQEIPQVQFVQQGCWHASGSAASGADGVEQQKLWERLWQRDNVSNKIAVLKWGDDERQSHWSADANEAD